MLLDKSFNISIIIGICAIWLLMIGAKRAEYDFNYGFFIWAFVISSLVVISIAVLCISRKAVARHSALVFIFFFLTSSPASLLSFLWLYEDIIGQYFKL